MDKGKNSVIIITGPTGVGKTDFVDSLALRMPIEIVNIDMGQLYAPLSIGTAKPDWKSAQTPHHLFDILTDPLDCTVVVYRNRLVETIQEIWSHNRIPVLVGGSLFYIKSLFFMPQEALNDHDQLPSRDQCTWDYLHSLDPQRAEKIHKNDFYRIQRAIAVWQNSGVKPSSLSPQFLPIQAHITMLFLTRDKAELHDRIRQRIDTMMNAGWLSEIASLQETDWVPFLKRKKLIGYNELLAYHEAQDPDGLDDVLRLINQRTRAYAKRQHTFWRMLERQIYEAIASNINPFKITTESVNLTTLDPNLYIKQLFDKIGQP